MKSIETNLSSFKVRLSTKNSAQENTSNWNRGRQGTPQQEEETTRSVYQILTQPPKEIQMTPVQRVTQKLGDGVFILKKANKVAQKGPFPPTRETIEQTMTIQNPFEPQVYTQFEKSPRLPECKYKQQGRGESIERQSIYRVVNRKEKSNMAAQKSTENRLPNLVDPKNYKLQPKDLFGFFDPATSPKYETDSKIKESAVKGQVQHILGKGYKFARTPSVIHRSSND